MGMLRLKLTLLVSRCRNTVGVGFSVILLSQEVMPRCFVNFGGKADYSNISLSKRMELMQWS